MSEQHDETTMRVRQAIAGDPDGVTWMVERFSPLLRAQAVHRLGPVLAGRIDPDDVVSEAWLVTLRRLGDLVPRDERFTPVLLRFLASVVQNVANARMRGFFRDRGAGGEASSSQVSAEWSATITGAVSQASGNELARRIAACLAGLDDAHRQVVILRGVEGRSNEEVAEELGEKANTVAQRYRRAIQKLRTCLPRSVFDELESG